MKRCSGVVLVSVLALVGCSDADPLGLKSADPPGISADRPDSFRGSAEFIGVMTRNVYLGGDIGRVLGAASVSDVPGLVATTWSEVLANDFTARARALAAEIDEARPHIVGLQEVALFRMQDPGDFFVGNPVAAEQVASDYLELLLDALEDRGLDYRPVVVLENADVELPMATSPTTFADLRLTDRDVILARGDVRVRAEGGAHFDAEREITLGSLTIPFPRGWTAVEARVRGRWYRLVNTHLEVQDARSIQEAQAMELLDVLAGSSLPTILVGDLNSDPDATSDFTASYDLIVGDGFLDVWTDAPAEGDGFTCCYDKTLRSAGLVTFERIDHVLVRDAVPGPAGSLLPGTAVRIVGDDPGAMPGGGGPIWPSDHRGLAAELHLPQARTAARGRR